MPHSNSARDSRKATQEVRETSDVITQRGDGRWCKRYKSNGTWKWWYFRGSEAEALDEWKRVKEDLIAGRQPSDAGGGYTLGELCNQFLRAKRSQHLIGKLEARSFVEYTRVTDMLVGMFGKNRLVEDFRPDDFEQLYHKLARKHGLTTIGREITMVRSVFKYAADQDRIERAVKFGTLFKSPNKADKRKDRARRKHTHGARMFSADELQAMLAKAGPQLKAMLLLGCNCGFGNTDCARLPLSAVDLDAGWIDYPRPKTGIERRVPLWPETIESLRTVIDAKRPTPKDAKHAALVFITRTGQPWVRYDLSESKNDDGKEELLVKADDAIAKATRKLTSELGIYRRGLSFYALRHGFETVAGAAGDQVAVDAVMGHVDASMAAEYREHIQDDRLKAVVEHVRAWLFPATAGEAMASKQRQKPALKVVG